MNDMVTKERSSRGENSGMAKLTEDEVLKIRSIREDGWAQEAIAKEFRVGCSTIRHILNGETWVHLSTK